MSIQPRQLGLVLLLLSVCSVAGGSNLVTSGTIQVNGQFQTIGTWTLSGNGFVVSGIFAQDMWLQFCAPCDPNRVMDMGMDVRGINFYDGSANVGGQNFPYLIWGYLDAPKPSIFQAVSTGIVLNHGFGTYKGSFYLNGELCGVQGFYLSPCVVDLPRIVGGGIVTFNYVQDPYLPWLGDVTAATYTFTYPYSTPEPATMWMVGSGLVAAIGAVRHRAKL